MTIETPQGKHLREFRFAPYGRTVSFSAHKRDALDVTLPIKHRMSHVRSCAVLMGFKYRVPRSVIIERVAARCGVDITRPGSEADIQQAVQALVLIKESGLTETGNGQQQEPCGRFPSRP